MLESIADLELGLCGPTDVLLSVHLRSYSE